MDDEINLARLPEAFGDEDRHRVVPVMLLGRVELALVDISFGALGMRKRSGGELSDNQLAVVGVALGEILAACGQCRATDQEQQRHFHEFAASVPHWMILRKWIFCDRRPRKKRADLRQTRPEGRGEPSVLEAPPPDSAASASSERHAPPARVKMRQKCPVISTRRLVRKGLQRKFAKLTASS